MRRVHNPNGVVSPVVAMTCKRCGLPGDFPYGRRVCRKCTIKEADENRRRRRKENPELCVRCVCRPRKPGLSQCEVCIERKREWDRNNPEKNRERERLRDRTAYEDRRKGRKNPYSRLAEHRRRARRLGIELTGGMSDVDFAELCARYDHRCLCCGRTDVVLTVDHIVPIVDGGSGNIGNVQPLCVSCNGYKSDKFVMDYRPLWDNPDTARRDAAHKGVMPEAE